MSSKEYPPYHSSCDWDNNITGTGNAHGIFYGCAYW